MYGRNIDMPVKAKEQKKSSTTKDAERLARMIRSFGDAISEIFEDPVVRQKAKAFSQSVIDSAAKVLDSKVKREEAKKKFREAGRAAQSLGKTLVEHFESEE
jgi:ribosomal-protein-alanine N-acetyltransferase